jgi:hypothetical protein
VNTVRGAADVAFTSSSADCRRFVRSSSALFKDVRDPPLLYSGGYYRDDSQIPGYLSPSNSRIYFALSSLETSQAMKKEIVDTPEKESAMHGVSDLAESPTLFRIAKKVWKEDVRLLFFFSFTLFNCYSQQFQGNR